MGAFFFKVTKGKFKVRSPKKKKTTKVQVQREQPRTRKWRPVDSMPYHGWSWPRVVGLTASEADRVIKRDCPGVYCVIVHQNQLLTMCYCSHRVRIMVDRYGKVVKTPHVG